MKSRSGSPGRWAHAATASNARRRRPMCALSWFPATRILRPGLRRRRSIRPSVGRSIVTSPRQTNGVVVPYVVRPLLQQVAVAVVAVPERASEEGDARLVFEVRVGEHPRPVFLAWVQSCAHQPLGHVSAWPRRRSGRERGYARPASGRSTAPHRAVEARSRFMSIPARSRLSMSRLPGPVRPAGRAEPVRVGFPLVFKPSRSDSREAREPHPFGRREPRRYPAGDESLRQGDDLPSARRAGGRASCSTLTLIHRPRLSGLKACSWPWTLTHPSGTSVSGTCVTSSGGSERMTSVIDAVSAPSAFSRPRIRVKSWFPSTARQGPGQFRTGRAPAAQDRAVATDVTGAHHRGSRSHGFVPAPAQRGVHRLHRRPRPFGRAPYPLLVEVEVRPDPDLRPRLGRRHLGAAASPRPRGPSAAGAAGFRAPCGPPPWPSTAGRTPGRVHPPSSSGPIVSPRSAPARAAGLSGSRSARSARTAGEFARRYDSALSGVRWSFIKVPHIE